MYDKIKAVFVLAAGIFLILSGIAYKVPALGKYFVKKEVFENPEEMRKLGTRSIPMIVIGIGAIVLSVLLFMGKF